MYFSDLFNWYASIIGGDSFAGKKFMIVRGLFYGEERRETKLSKKTKNKRIKNSLEPVLAQ